MRLAVIFLVVSVASYVAWVVAISDHESNTVWSLLAGAAFYGSVAGVLGCLARALWRRGR